MLRTGVCEAGSGVEQYLQRSILGRCVRSLLLCPLFGHMLSQRIAKHQHTAVDSLHRADSLHRLACMRRDHWLVVYCQNLSGAHVVLPVAHPLHCSPFGTELQLPGLQSCGLQNSAHATLDPPGCGLQYLFGYVDVCHPFHTAVPVKICYCPVCLTRWLIGHVIGHADGEHEVLRVGVLRL
jgi:hypothetical protein